MCVQSNHGRLKQRVFEVKKTTFPIGKSSMIIDQNSESIIS